MQRTRQRKRLKLYTEIVVSWPCRTIFAIFYGIFFINIYFPPVQKRIHFIFKRVISISVPGFLFVIFFMIMQYQARGEELLCFRWLSFWWMTMNSFSLSPTIYSLPALFTRRSNSQMNWKSSSSFQFIFGYIAAQLSTVKFGVFYNEPKRPEDNSIQSVV